MLPKRAKRFQNYVCYPFRWDNLRAIVDQLRDMEDPIYCIKVRLMEWMTIFNAYNSVAHIKMDETGLNASLNSILLYYINWDHMTLPP